MSKKDDAAAAKEATANEAGSSGPRRVTPVSMDAGGDLPGTPLKRPDWVAERPPIGESATDTWTPAGTPVDPDAAPERGPIGSYTPADETSADGATSSDPATGPFDSPDGTPVAATANVAAGSGGAPVPNPAPADQTQEDRRAQVNEDNKAAAKDAPKP